VKIDDLDDFGLKLPPSVDVIKTSTFTFLTMES